MLFSLDCECDSNGSTLTQCDLTGICSCYPGYTGDKCDSCESDYYRVNSDCIGKTFC